MAGALGINQAWLVDRHLRVRLLPRRSRRRAAGAARARPRSGSTSKPSATHSWWSCYGGGIGSVAGTYLAAP